MKKLNKMKKKKPKKTVIENTHIIILNLFISTVLTFMIVKNKCILEGIHASLENNGKESIINIILFFIYIFIILELTDIITVETTTKKSVKSKFSKNTSIHELILEKFSVIFIIISSNQVYYLINSNFLIPSLILALAIYSYMKLKNILIIIAMLPFLIKSHYRYYAEFTMAIFLFIYLYYETITHGLKKQSRKLIFIAVLFALILDTTISYDENTRLNHKIFEIDLITKKVINNGIMSSKWPFIGVNLFVLLALLQFLLLEKNIFLTSIFTIFMGLSIVEPAFLLIDYALVIIGSTKFITHNFKKSNNNLIWLGVILIALVSYRMNELNEIYRYNKNINTLLTVLPELEIKDPILIKHQYCTEIKEYVPCLPKTKIEVNYIDKLNTSIVIEKKLLWKIKKEYLINKHGYKKSLEFGNFVLLSK